MPNIKYTITPNNGHVMIRLFKDDDLEHVIAHVAVFTNENALNNFDIPEEANRNTGLSYALIYLGVQYLRRYQAQTVLVPDCNEASARSLKKCRFTESNLAISNNASNRIYKSRCEASDAHTSQIVAAVKLGEKGIKLAFHDPVACVIM